MRVHQSFFFRLLGCFVIAAAIVVTNVGHMRARSHIVPTPSPTSAPVLITGDISFGETYWLVPGVSRKFGMIQFSGGPYRARHTDIYLGTYVASVPLTIPWLLAALALVLTGLVLLFQSVTYDRGG